MERFVAECNITRFEQMLRDEVDPDERRVIEELLAEEHRKLRRAASSIGTDPAPVLQSVRPLAFVRVLERDADEPANGARPPEAI
jgi:transcriptional regulator with GAF, ATPase, and Fis domain